MCGASLPRVGRSIIISQGLKGGGKRAEVEANMADVWRHYDDESWCIARLGQVLVPSRFLGPVT